MAGHLRKPRRNPTTDDLRYDREKREDHAKQEELRAPDGCREVHLQTERDEEDRREDGSQVTGALGEVLPEGRAAEQTPCKERPEDRREPDHLRDEGGEERKSQCDEENAGEEPQLHD